MLPKTPNLSLNKWESTDAFDVDQVNANFDNIENLLTPFTCTSTTRPTSNLFRGRVIYETDTATYRWWSGTAWLRIYMPSDGSIGVINSVRAVESGWSLGSGLGMLHGALASVYIVLTRTGPDLVSNAHGDIGNITVGYLEDAFRPRIGSPLPTLDGKAVTMSIWSSANSIQITALPANVNINTGNTLTFGGTYPRYEF